MKKLTVITINYNNVKGLKETLESVLSQTYKDFEFIVIDGGSSDGSKEVIETYSSGISKWVSERDSGIYNAMNKGLSFSQGEYVLFMNSGDTFYSAQTLETVVPYLNAGVDIVYGDCLDVNFPDSKKEEFFRHPEKLTFSWLYTYSFRHQAVFVRSKLHQDLGTYDENYKIVSDWKFLLLALVLNHATYKKIDVLVCRFDRSGLSSTNFKLSEQEKKTILKDLFPYFVDDYIQFKRFIIDKLNSSQKFSIRSIIKMILPYGYIRHIQMRKDKIASRTDDV